jgi:hypothetical protein
VITVIVRITVLLSEASEVRLMEWSENEVSKRSEQSGKSEEREERLQEG